MCSLVHRVFQNWLLQYINQSGNSKLGMRLMARIEELFFDMRIRTQFRENVSVERGFDGLFYEDKGRVHNVSNT